MTHRCPDEETLAAWFDGLLPPAEEAALQRELGTCPDCIELVTALGYLIDAEPPDAFHTPAPAAAAARATALWPAAPLADRVAAPLRLAVRWLGEQLAPLADALAPMAQPALALRGGAAAAQAQPQLTWRLDLGSVPFEVTLTADGPAHVDLTLRPLAPPPDGTLLRLSADGETCALSSLDTDGATVSALPTGTYALSLEGATGELGRLQIDLTNQA